MSGHSPSHLLAKQGFYASVVPAVAELCKTNGIEPMKSVGVTTLGVARANKFVGEVTGKSPNFINVPEPIFSPYMGIGAQD